MGTRGAISFVIDGEEKTTFNNSDSYPSYLGVEIVRYLRSLTGLGEVAVAVRALRVVEEDEPTAEDVERFSKIADLGVATGSAVDWYCLLRGLQGDVPAILAAGVIEDASWFPLDSLFCEWAYVIDLDRAVFEVYKGFQREPHAEGRWAHNPPDRGYYPVRRLAAWSLERLPLPEDMEALEVDPQPVEAAQ